MKALLTESFSVENQEAQELINKIKTSFENQNKKAFLNSKKPVADAGYMATSKEEETIYIDNVYKILQELPILTSFAFVHILVQERRNDKPLNDILGHSDDIFIMCKNYSKEIKNKKDKKALEVLEGKAFYQQ